MHSKSLALLLLISTNYLQAIDDDHVRFTIVLVKETSPNPYKRESRLNPLLKKDWTISRVRKEIAKKSSIAWIGKQGAMYSNADQPFSDSHTLSHSMKNVSSAAKTTIYLRYDNSINPTYQFIHEDKVIKTIKTEMNYLRLSNMESDFFKKLKKQRENDDVVFYTYHKKTYCARNLCQKLDSHLPFLKRDSLQKKVCKISIAIKKKSQYTKASNLLSKLKNPTVLASLAFGFIVIVIGYLTTKKKSKKKPKKKGWFNNYQKQTI